MLILLRACDIQVKCEVYNYYSYKKVINMSKLDQKDYIGQDYFFVVHDLPVIDEEKYCVVYGKWLTSNNGCTYLRYPLLKDITRCLKQKKEPKEDWKKVEVKVIAIFDNLNKANQKLKKILNYESSTTDNDVEHKIQRKKKGIHHHFEDYTLNSSSEEESDHLPQLPQLIWNKQSCDKLLMYNGPHITATIVPNEKSGAGAILSENYNITTPNKEVTTSSSKENVTYDHGDVQKNGVIEHTVSSFKENVKYAQEDVQKNAAIEQLLPGANNTTIGSPTLISHSSDNGDRIQIVALEEAEFLTEHSLLVEIFKKLCSVETAIAAQDDKIHNILKSLAISVPAITVDLPKIPIDTLDDLNNLNAILDNQVIFDAMVAELRRFCGSCERDCVLKMLPRIFDFELARICSLKGRNNNFKLEGCKVLDIMRCAVKQNYPTMTYTIFNLAISDWFRGAELRHKRKMKSNRAIYQGTELHYVPEV